MNLSPLSHYGPPMGVRARIRVIVKVKVRDRVGSLTNNYVTTTHSYITTITCYVTIIDGSAMILYS